MELYTYFRSSAAYRVRIALNIKELEADYRYVHLVRDGGEHHKPSFHKINPQERVPVLDDGGVFIRQSLAIIEYLDEIRPNPPLLPDDKADRAWIRSIAQLIACDIHPLNNLGVLKYLESQFGADQDAKNKWYRHWVMKGFDALEEMLSADARVSDYCYGKKVTLADVCLVPQVYNAERFNVDMSRYPVIQAIAANCRKLDAFAKAAPEAQRDAE